MDEYFEDGYEVEPFMPGISPVGKATPATTGVSIPKPHIPLGTGYKYFRSKPGFSNVFDELKNKNLIGEYQVHGPRPLTPEEKRFKAFNEKLFGPDNNPPKPKIRFFTNAGSFSNPGPREHRILHQLSKIRDTIETGTKGPVGSYGSAMKTLAIPAKGYQTSDPLAKATHSIDKVSYPIMKTPHGNLDTRGIRRHEFAHALDHRANPDTNFRFPDKPGYSDFKSELAANIAQEKSIRKGLARTASSYPDYEREAMKYIDDQIDRKAPKKPGYTQVRFGHSPEAEAAKAEWDKQNKPYLKANELLKKIPWKPGSFTGRVPTFGSIGANLVDMIMMSPEFQRAKEDPTFGIGDAERERLEAAYEYGL
jgi:hypothetical protein